LDADGVVLRASSHNQSGELHAFAMLTSLLGSFGFGSTAESQMPALQFRVEVDNLEDTFVIVIIAEADEAAENVPSAGFFLRGMTNLDQDLVLRFGHDRLEVALSHAERAEDTIFATRGQ
jgi:hypothetical protein